MLSFLFSRPLLALRQDREGEDCQRKGRKSGRECPGPEQNRFSEIPHFLISGSARENNCGKQSPEPMARLSLTHPTGLCLPADVIKHVHSSRDPKLTNFIHQPSTKIELNQSQGLLITQPSESAARDATGLLVDTGGRLEVHFNCITQEMPICHLYGAESVQRSLPLPMAKKSSATTQIKMSLP